MLGYSESILSGLGLPQTKEELHKRGINVYTMSEVVGVSGRGKDGRMIQGTVEVPLFGLSVFDRLMIAQKCDAVFGVVTSRANRISGLEWGIVRESKVEDKVADKLKAWKQVYDEYVGEGTPREIIVCGKIVREIRQVLPDVLPDLSNFDRALLRWRKRVQSQNDDHSSAIEDWLHEPNSEDDFEDFLKKWTNDLMIHGADAIYKEYTGGRLNNFYHLPGGSVVPLRGRYVGAQRIFAQIMPGMDPKMYFQDEITFSSYMPNSGISGGLVPLEALVNKVAEGLFFDQRAAEMADGTVPPEKVALFGQSMPFGDLTGDESLEVPLSEAEQTKLEILLNEPRKNAIRVLTGYGTPQVLDLSRSDTFQHQSERQRFLRECTGFVFNMSNMEMNLTGSDDTSGRSTSEAQDEIEKNKGIRPIVITIQNKINRELIPLRWGSGYLFEFKSGLTEEQQIELDDKAVRSQTYSVNERRVKRGDEPWGPEFDKPMGGQPQSPDGSEQAPLNVRGLM